MRDKVLGFLSILSSVVLGIVVVHFVISPAIDSYLQNQLEKQRKQSYSDGYERHVLAAAKTSDIIIATAEIEIAMDYAYSLVIDADYATEKDIADIKDWYNEKLAAQTVLWKYALRDQSSEENEAVLMAVMECFVTESVDNLIVNAPDKIWLKTYSSGETEADQNLGPMIPKEILNDIPASNA